MKRRHLDMEAGFLTGDGDQGRIDPVG
jgi:hypothetical protein